MHNSTIYGMFTGSGTGTSGSKIVKLKVVIVATPSDCSYS